MLQRESASSHQELEQLRQEMTNLQPLYSPTAPQDSDLWKLQMEVSFIKGSKYSNRTHICQYRCSVSCLLFCNISYSVRYMINCVLITCGFSFLNL